MHVSCLPPIVPDRPRLLILGSMPSAASIAAGEYYAHPRNQFWPLIGSVVGVVPPALYARRIAMLCEAQIALWDVLARCERQGSLDSAISRPSEIPNAIAAFVAEHSGIGVIGLNGGRAAECFRRHIVPQLDNSGIPDIVVLPSSSPANARMLLSQKCQVWSSLSDCLD